MIMISDPAFLGSSMCQITAGQVAAQFNLSSTLWLASTGGQLSQLQGRTFYKKSDFFSRNLYFSRVFPRAVPDGDVSEFLWGDCDAF